MAELRNCADHLQQDNDRMHARLEEDRDENTQESNHPTPLVKQNRGKEPILPGNSDATMDDELSSSSSPLPDLSPPRTTWRLNQERGPRTVLVIPLVACIVEYEEKSVESNDSQSRPSKMCPRGTGV